MGDGSAMLCIPKQNHKKLVEECYPAKKALAQVAPEYSPNSNELGRLVYYAQSKPAKLTKVGRVLVEHATSETRAYRAGNFEKAKSLLMITLSILKELVASCKGSMAYLAPTVQVVLTGAMSAAAPKEQPASSWDLDVCTRVATTFSLYVQNMPAGEADTDEGASNAIFQVLTELQRLGEGQVSEQMRMVWMVAVDGLVRSPGLTTSLFSRFMLRILPSLLDCVAPTHISLARTASLSQEVDSDVVQFETNVTDATPECTTRVALKELWGILHRCEATQLRVVLTQTLSYLDGECHRPASWDYSEWPLWILAVLVQWSLPSSRYVVPHKLVNSLTSPKSSSNVRETRLLQALHVILESKTDIVGLNMTDLLDGHVYFLLSHVQSNPYDKATVQATIDAVCHLADYTLYVDQLDDFVQQITPHLVSVVHDNDVPSESKTHSVCALLSCLQALVRTHATTHIPLQTWASTETLLASPIPAIRVAYLHTLNVYLQTELEIVQKDLASPESVNECIGFLHALATHMTALAMCGLPSDGVISSWSSTPSDFAMMRTLLDTLFTVAPTSTVLAFVPPLIALAQATSHAFVGEPAIVNHALTCRWLVGAAFAQISIVWQEQAILDYLHSQLLPTLGDIAPMMPHLSDEYDPVMVDVLPFGASFYTEAPACQWDIPFLIGVLASNSVLQSRAHANEKSLETWFQRPWTTTTGETDARMAARPTITRAPTTRGVLRASSSTLTRENTVDVRTLRMALSQTPSEKGVVNAAGLDTSASGVPASLLRQPSGRLASRDANTLASSPNTPMVKRMSGRMAPASNNGPGSVSDVLDRYTSTKSKRTPAFPQSPSTPTPRVGMTPARTYVAGNETSPYYSQDSHVLETPSSVPAPAIVSP